RVRRGDLPDRHVRAARRAGRRLGRRPARRGGGGAVAGEDRLTEPPVTVAPVAAEIAAELPGLGLAWCAFAVTGDPLARSPAALRARLRALSDRSGGDR